MFNPSKKTTANQTPSRAVPAHLTDAYREAEPDVDAFMEKAARQLAYETLHNRRNSGAVGPDDVRAMYQTRLKEIVELAEHLARLAHAGMLHRREVAAREREERAEANRCPVCGLRNGELSYRNPHTGARSFIEPMARMCEHCGLTAELLYFERCATEARRVAIDALRAATA